MAGSWEDQVAEGYGSHVQGTWGSGMGGNTPSTFPDAGSEAWNRMRGDARSEYDHIKNNISQAELEAARKALEEGRPADSFGETILKSILGAITPDAIEGLAKQWASAWQDDQIKAELARAQMLERGYTNEQIDDLVGQSNFSAGDTSHDTGDGESGGAQGQADNTQGNAGQSETPQPINAETAEEYLLNKFMDIYNNPDMDMSELFQDYMSSLDRGNEILQGSEAVTKQYGQDIQGLLDTPGVALSLGGKPIQNTAGENAVLKPLNTIRTQQGLLGDRYGADIEDLTRRAAAEQTTGAAKWDALSAPVQDMLKTLITSRRGVTSSSDYTPEWWERWLQVALS